MRYAIIGCGALGGYYGGLLARAGLDVHFLLNSDYDHVCRQGLRIDSKNGDFVLPTVAAYSDPAKMPPADVVVIGLKSTQNHLLAKLIPPVLARDGVVLTLQNGLGIEGPIADLVGPERVLAGLCFLCSNKIGPGHIHHLDYGMIKFGQYTLNGAPGGIGPRLEGIAHDFESAGIPVSLDEDLLRARWQKLVWNIPYNALTVILDTTTDAIMRNPATRSLVERLMGEVLAGAAACGKVIEPEFIEVMLSHTDQMTPYKPSMKLDYDRRQPMEVQAIFANPVRSAEEHGVSLASVAVLRDQLWFLDHRNTRTNG